MIKHDSMRGYFAFELYQQMKINKDIYLIVGDLGYKVFDSHFKDFPERCINVGAAEQSMMGIAVGLALSSKIPFVYSITTFLLYRPFETIRNYLNHEKIPVKLVGSGRDKDYKHDGFSHDASDVKPFLDLFLNIKQYWPYKKEEIPNVIKDIINNKKQSFISLKR